MIRLTGIKLQLLLVLLLSIQCLGCKKEDLSKNIGEQMILSFGDKGIYNDEGTQLEVVFSHLVEDSRCPEGANCIWEGRAVVELQINAEKVITLGIGNLIAGVNTPYVSTVEYGIYKISLLSVALKRKGQQGNETKYAVTILVEKK